MSSYANDTGYTPDSVEEIMEDFRVFINDEFDEAMTEEEFQGTNFYKYYYGLAQKLQLNGTKTSEIFSKLQQYFAITNEMISRPVATAPGVIEKLEDEGWIASVKPMIDADAGKIYVCVDVDNYDPDYATKKLAINTIIKDSVAAGVVTQGAQSSSIVLSNGQSFDFKFALPDRHRTYLRLTLALSENNQSVIKSNTEIKTILLEQIAAKYRLGRNFEPQKYFTTDDAPWAESVLLEWSTDNSNWFDTVIDAEFDDLYECALSDITLVEE